MASILAAKVIECIRKPSIERDDNSIQSVAGWFQSKVNLLEDADSGGVSVLCLVIKINKKVYIADIISNLLKQCVLATYEKDEIIIKEGDHGDV